ncbi:MAG: STAS domain-containing protein [Leptospiraceae bacterium]|nr:STAS domain-containing protein [Leptospiraceae bacterium]MCP5496878.1 STAS domain-containing protein [Leptospiraceae bacterium]
MVFNVDDYDLKKEPCFISQRTSNLPQNMTDETCIVDITGELNLYSAREMQEFFDSLIATGYKKICLDLSKLQYIDSSCLGVFLKSHVTLKKSGGYIRLISPSKEMTSIFQLTKLDKMLIIFDSAEKAVL